MSDWRRMKEEYDALARLAETRAVPVRRPARPLGHAVMRALAPILKEAGPAPDTLIARWSEIVGPRIAAVTEPLRVAKTKAGGVLHLRAPSAAAPMIQHAAEHILQKVNLASGAKLKSIRIVHTSGAPKAAAKVRPSLTPDERETLVRSLAPVQTSAIRDALAGLGEAMLARRKDP
jgi:hypothetical protein